MYLYTDSPHQPLFTLGGLVAHLRGALGLSQAVLAARCQMPLTQLELFEQGQFLHSSTQAFALSEILGLDPVMLCSCALLQRVGVDLAIAKES